MPRSGRAARERLERAALDLYAERGFDAVTIAEIAERADVTQRTYFRHFPDKREVLFGGEQRLLDWVSDAFATVEPSANPMTTLRAVIARVVPSIEANREASGRLAALIAATPALLERSAGKEAVLVAAMSDQLVDGGIEPERAAIASRAAWAVLTEAVRAWRARPEIPLQGHVDRGFSVLYDTVSNA
jgi:AcrR family transcriptional regulator